MTARELRQLCEGRGLMVVATTDGNRGVVVKARLHNTKLDLLRGRLDLRLFSSGLANTIIEVENPPSSR